MKPLKWNKVEWRKDQLTGNWVPPSDNSAKEIEQYLDKYHKSIWHKRKMKLEALDNLREALDAYVSKNKDPRVVNLLEKRLNQVVKKRLQYNNAMEFVKKLKLEQVLDNRYLLDGFARFVVREVTQEHLEFLIDVGYVVGSSPQPRQNVITKYIVQGSPSQINISAQIRTAIENGGSFNDAINAVLALLRRDNLPRFRLSDELKDALEHLSQFNR